MENATSEYVFSTDPWVISVTVLGNICILWILVGNTITLIAVCDIKIERQKKQVISLLIANMYNGIVNLPITLLLWHDLEILNDRLVCGFALGLTDFGELTLTSFPGVLTVNMFLTFKFPFKSDTFSRWETPVVLLQWILPVCYTVAVYIAMSGDIEYIADDCDWNELPSWYHYLNTVLIVIATTVPFVLSVAILCLAWKQVGAVTAMEMSTQAAPSSRSVGMKVKHRRLAKLTIGAFLLIWAPLAITEIVSYGLSVYDSDVYHLRLLEMVYFFILCLRASFPLFYSYTFSGVKPQVMLMLKKLHIWRKQRREES